MNEGEGPKLAPTEENLPRAPESACLRPSLQILAGISPGEQIQSRNRFTYALRVLRSSRQKSSNLRGRFPSGTAKCMSSLSILARVAHSEQPRSEDTKNLSYKRLGSFGKNRRSAGTTRWTCIFREIDGLRERRQSYHPEH